MKAAADIVMADQLDELSEFEQFRSDVLPMLRRAVREGWDKDKILKQVESHLTAKIVTVALTEKNPGAAMVAVKEAFDRLHGKPTQQVEQTTRIQKMTDEEINALIKSGLEEIKQ